MFTIQYKHCFINAYTNKAECFTVIQGNGEESIKSHKTIIGAKRYITKELKRLHQKRFG